MRGYLLGRLVSGIIVIFLALTAVFFMVRASGDPVLLFAPLDTSLEGIEAIRERMGFNDPLVVQYARFIGDAVQGDFGDSTRERRPAMEIVLERLPATLQLGGVALLISLTVGIPLGILSATISIAGRLRVGQACAGHFRGRAGGAGVLAWPAADPLLLGAAELATDERSGRLRPHHPALRHAGGTEHRAVRAIDQIDDAGCARAGLHPHRQGEGSW
jgi:hypothetical protein